MDFVAPVISTLALTVSGITAYLTLFRRGTIRMTQPTVIFFGPDGGPNESGRSSSKVFLRTLLYATSKRGRIVESMYVRLRRGETSQNFNIWIYGDISLARGSGLFVGENGIACNHHFLLPRDGVSFQFGGGEYELEVYGALAGSASPLRLLSVRLSLPGDLAAQLSNPKAGVYFDWGPDSRQYHPHIDLKPERNLSPELLETLAAMRTAPPSPPGAPTRPGDTVYYLGQAFRFVRWGGGNSRIETVDGSSSAILPSKTNTDTCPNNTLFQDPEGKQSITRS